MTVSARMPKTLARLAFWRVPFAPLGRLVET